MTNEITTEQMLEYCSDIIDDGGYNTQVPMWEAIRSRLSEYDALKAEVERLQRQVGIEQRKVSDLDGLLVKYHKAAEEADAWATKLNESHTNLEAKWRKAEAELEAARPLFKAVNDAFCICHVRQCRGSNEVIEAAIHYRLNNADAYRAAKSSQSCGGSGTDE